MKRIILLTVAMFMLTGCFQFSTYMKYYEDGTFDMTFNMTSDMWDEITNSSEEDTSLMEACPEVMAKYEEIELENGIQMVFTGIDPATDTCIFADAEDPDQDANPFGEEMPMPVKEERADGTYYVIELPNEAGDTENMSDEEIEMMKSMFSYEMYFEVFGDIVETNGVKVTDRIVKFDVFDVVGDMKIVFKKGSSSSVGEPGGAIGGNGTDVNDPSMGTGIDDSSDGKSGNSLMIIIIAAVIFIAIAGGALFAFKKKANPTQQPPPGTGVPPQQQPAQQPIQQQPTDPNAAAPSMPEQPQQPRNPPM